MQETNHRKTNSNLTIQLPKKTRKTSKLEDSLKTIHHFNIIDKKCNERVISCTTNEVTLVKADAQASQKIVMKSNINFKNNI